MQATGRRQSRRIPSSRPCQHWRPLPQPPRRRGCRRWPPFLRQYPLCRIGGVSRRGRKNGERAKRRRRSDLPPRAVSRRLTFRFSRFSAWQWCGNEKKLIHIGVTQTTQGMRMCGGQQPYLSLPLFFLQHCHALLQIIFDARIPLLLLLRGNGTKGERSQETQKSGTNTASR